MKKALWIIFGILGLVGAGVGISLLVRKKSDMWGASKYLD